MGLSKFDHISCVLRDRLHWLPVPQRIQYKLCLLVHKALHRLAPQYLAYFCSLFQLSMTEADCDRPRSMYIALATAVGTYLC